MNAEIPIGGLEKFLNVVKGQPFTHCQSTDDPQPNSLVDEPVKMSSLTTGRQPERLLFFPRASFRFFLAPRARPSHRIFSQ
jgi:hypothetical protein